ncbi:unnamed protein product [Rotaria socialis]|uniref:Ion transport domain-containing protein n=1 Tax=Rotaria socialis TaxID=392032 RepID=A0A818Q4Q6_9BILA|nr:unnamed protein product [Rotaria socialis]CAF4150278.1 unnamed protein product [Rotaria socialis]CAF4531630.1 unnamed protein product [Rotaria socialis]CAF4625276.1 unnamed protein product [Rotaria socialis]
MTVFVINLLIGLAVGEISTLVQLSTLLQSRIDDDTLSDYDIFCLQIRSTSLNEQIHDGVDEEVKQQYAKRKKTKLERAQDTNHPEQK